MIDSSKKEVNTIHKNWKHHKQDCYYFKLTLDNSIGIENMNGFYFPRGSAYSEQIFIYLLLMHGSNVLEIFVKRFRVQIPFKVVFVFLRALAFATTSSQACITRTLFLVSSSTRWHAVTSSTTCPTCSLAQSWSRW